MTDAPNLSALVEEAFDASDAKQVKKRKAAAKVREEQRRRVIATILSTKPGREFFWQLIADSHVFEKRISMTGEHENGFFEGQREIGLQLMRRLCRSAPGDFATMFAENDNG